MLRNLAVLLAVLIVIILAVVAAMTVVDSGAGDEPREIVSDPTAAGPRATIEVAIGPGGQPLQVACHLPVADQNPLLVSFENRSGVLDDYLAEVSVSFADGSTTEVLAEALQLRSGERRSVVPTPWLEPESIVNCAIKAIQHNERIILIDDD